MLAHGTTTVEAKSGNGLTVEDELKILETAKRINQLHCVKVASTFMGAHIVPFEYKGNTEEYVDLIVEEMLSKVSKQNIAEFCDVFCERGAFNMKQAKRILIAGRRYNLKPRFTLIK